MLQSLPARLLRAGIVFDGVCDSVCLCVRLPAQNLKNYCVNARSDWKLVTFDLDLWPWELFSYFLFYIHISSIINSFECLNLATNFSR